jgi:hypothetical protein
MASNRTEAVRPLASEPMPMAQCSKEAWLVRSLRDAPPPNLDVGSEESMKLTVVHGVAVACRRQPALATTDSRGSPYAQNHASLFIA